jgi:hypothetical protein
MLFDPGKQFGQADAETSGDRERRLDGEVVFAALDASHVGAMKAAMIGEGFLREALLPPQLTYSVPENHR